jgi:tetratricopeptide (TPR) repeat protein
MEGNKANIISRQCITCDGPRCDQVAPSKSCSRCKIYYYCSRNCQKQHWNVHKEYCQIIVDRKERNIFLEAEKKPANLECGICLEEHSDRRVLVPGCNHGFCYPCLIEWRDIDDEESIDREDKTYCPLCRKHIEDGVENDVMCRAKLYGVRAARKGIGEQEKKEHLQVAFAELGKVLSANNKESLIKPLLVKADILRNVGDYRQATSVLKEVSEMYKDAKSHTDRMYSFLAESRARSFLSESEKNTFRNRVEELKNTRNELLLTGVQSERLNILQLKTQLAELKCDLGDFEEALAILDGGLTQIHEEDLSTREARQRCFVHLRCNLGCRQYDNVIKGCKPALSAKNGRSFAPLYKYMALAQRQKGDVKGAAITINKALLYVSLCEEEDTREEFLKLYEELQLS